MRWGVRRLDSGMGCSHNRCEASVVAPRTLAGRESNADRPPVHATRGCVPAWADLDTTCCHLRHEGKAEARRISDSRVLLRSPDVHDRLLHVRLVWTRILGAVRRGSAATPDVDFADEILWSSVAALVFSFTWIYGSTRRWMTRFLNRVGAATTHGKEDIWDLTFSRLHAEVEYVHVRDLERGITYAGWVRAYSETGRPRELLLRDAIVWDKTGADISVPLLYLARQDTDMHIEFPYREEPQETDETPEGGDHGENS